MRADAPPRVGVEPLRDETDTERLDRHLIKLLSEVRVVRTGVQVLFAFLLTAPFRMGRKAYMVEMSSRPALGITVVSAAALIGVWAALPLRRRREVSAAARRGRTPGRR
jgi:protein-S-isoprenylcysteine O-methyltransferase Ste14